ncbi:hypothetical protein [uncultured Jannaschia sp.]|uniref:hypothetical protein n=1 Tax=uncultured Jannaschia sp. TaxID=293347 RepID=UPI00260FF6A5|nr:hypothetical protein [uncultured Jannaschia sp.]
MKKAAGLDVNGWRDHVARNWTTIPGEDAVIDRIHVGSAGPLTSVVQIGEGRTALWIGGQPADLAPHGKGGGWGQIGDVSRRRSVRDLLEGRGGETAHLAAAFADFARRANHTVLAIEDSPDTIEAMQERLLNGMARARCGTPTLVWRTVLAALHAIDAGLIQDECIIGIVSHVSSGLSIQKLRIRSAGSRGGILTPERKALATILEGSAGLRGLVTLARQAAIGADGYSARTAHRTQTRTIGRVAFGMQHEPEIVRLDKGGWEVIDAPVLPASALNPTERVVDLSDCAEVFFETVTEGRVCAEVRALARTRGLNIDTTLLPDAVARGALVAAQRMANGDPVYYDFLPRISTIVFGKTGATNYDLIDETETLEAGRIYRSPQPAKLAIPKGVVDVSIYLRKDAEAHPRKATVTLDMAPTCDIPVSVWVEQKPAAGRAKIVLDASAMSRSFQVDWDNADDDPRDWDDIIASLATPPPAIPDRLVLSCGLEPWEASNRGPGMINLLAEAQESSSPNWETLAQKAMARPHGNYCVSSDGLLPIGLPNLAAWDLDRVVARALAVTRQRLEDGPMHAESNNAALQFLTWQFRRCPSVVSEWLLDCIENHAGQIGTHPFAQTAANWTLLYQGLARTAIRPEIEQRILRAILDSNPTPWKWNREIACLALLISRSETAPQLLSRKDIDCIGQRIVVEIQREVGTEYTRFYYTNLLAAGIFRYRRIEPHALLVDHDPLGNKLLGAFDAVRCDFIDRSLPSKAFKRKRERYVPIMEDLLRYVRGEGGNSGLLINSYNA